MEKNLVTLLKDLKKNLENIPAKNGKKIRYIKELNQLIEMYSGLKIEKQHAEKYGDLVKRGIELNEGDNYRNIKKIEKLLPLSFCLYYEIKGQTSSIMKKLSYSFFLTCILFVLVSFPTLPPLVTILFVAPMYIGIRGLSKGMARGLAIGMSVIEFSALVGVMTFSLIMQALPKYGKFVNGLVTRYSNERVHISTTSMGMIVAVYGLLALALIGSSAYNIYYYYKYKRIFL